MKFHFLIAAVFLLLAFDSGATLLSAEVPAAAGGTPVRAAPAADKAEAYVYQNGDLVLDIRDTAGAEILRAGLSYFFCDEHIATANELPAGTDADPVQVEQQQPTLADDEAPQPADTLPQPFSLGLLGAGIAMLGWTRRGEGLFERFKRKLGLADLLPWPALCWLD